MGASAEMTAQNAAPTGAGASSVATAASSAAASPLITTLLIIVAIVAAVIIIENIAEYFLARKDRFYWGLILPAAHLVYGIVRYVMLILANRKVTSVSADTKSLIIQTALISLICLELLTEYMLVRKNIKVRKKLAPAAEPEPEAEEA